MERYGVCSGLGGGWGGDLAGGKLDGLGLKEVADSIEAGLHDFYQLVARVGLEANSAATQPTAKQQQQTTSGIIHAR